MTTIHAYTADQRLQDPPHKDLRRARAAALNLDARLDRRREGDRPRAPELKGKLDGFAMRVPVPTGSVVDLTSRPTRETTRDEINARDPRQADSGAAEGILAVHRGPDRLDRTSSATRTRRSSTRELTTVIDGTLVKVVAWYDNEWGYSNRCVDLVQKVLRACARSTTSTSTGKRVLVRVDFNVPLDGTARSPTTRASARRCRR